MNCRLLSMLALLCHISLNASSNNKCPSIISQLLQTAQNDIEHCRKMLTNLCCYQSKHGRSSSSTEFFNTSTNTPPQFRRLTTTEQCSLWAQQRFSELITFPHTNNQNQNTIVPTEWFNEPTATNTRNTHTPKDVTLPKSSTTPSLPYFNSSTTVTTSHNSPTSSQGSNTETENVLKMSKSVSEMDFVYVEDFNKTK